MFQELLEASFDKQTEHLYTAIPAVVVTVRDNFNQLTIDAQPTINIKDRDLSTKERPVVLNVPVQMPSSSTAALTFPINVGDPVLLVYSMRGLDTWKRGSGVPVTPSDFRKFDRRDCIAIPGIWPFSKSINNPSVRVWQHDTGDLVIVNNIGSNENEVRLKKSGDIQVNTNQNVEVVCNNATITAQANVDVVCNNFTVDAAESISMTAPSASFSIGSTSWSGAISQSGNYTGVGVQTFNGIVFSSHVHGASPPPS